MEKYKDYTLTQLKNIITENNPDQSVSVKFSDLYRLIWKKEAILNNAIKLARALRKDKNSEEAYNFHEKFKELYPNNKQLEGERLWCDFSFKVCNSDNLDYAANADNILKVCSQDDVSTKMIFEVVTLYTVSRLVKDEEYLKAYRKLIKLKPNLLETVARGPYPSNKLKFYSLKAKTLIGLNSISDYFNWAYSILNFSKEKKTEFINEIIKRITFEFGGYNEIRFANLLHDIDNEINTKRLAKTFVNECDYIRISELSDYLFCPVSFAINKSYNIPNSVSINSKERNWSGKKEGFLDKYKQYQANSNFDICFENFRKISSEVLGADIFASMKMEFEKLFKTKIITNNTIDNNLISFRSDNRELVGAPDFILEAPNGEKILLMEKFSSAKASGNDKVFNTNIIEIETYLTKFKSLNISVGYFVNWIFNIESETIENENLEISSSIEMVSVTLKKISIDDCREAYIDDTLGKINSLLKNVQLPASNIGFVNKCLACSAKEFCCHKTGELNYLELPYKIKPLSL